MDEESKYICWDCAYIGQVSTIRIAQHSTKDVYSCFRWDSIIYPNTKICKEFILREGEIGTVNPYYLGIKAKEKDRKKQTLLLWGLSVLGTLIGVIVGFFLRG